MEDLISIGRFADASRLSAKALRLYDENGLLPPARVDADSGYRYYRREQLRDATTIRLLRACGMPLAEIKSFLAAPSAGALEEYEHALGDQLDERKRILRYLRNRLEEEPMFEVQTKRVDEQAYVSRTKRVRVAELEPFIVSTISDLWDEGTATGDAFSIYHGEVNEEDDGPVEVCVPRAEGEKRLPASEVAFTVAVGAQCEFPEIIGAYDAVADWAQRHGRELAGPPREIYRFDPHKDETPRMEIAWPLR